jgi:hypothetical protein
MLVSNFEKTINKPFLFREELNYLWAFNATTQGHNNWKRMKLGDICIFGNRKRNWCRTATVINKMEIEENEFSMWPFLSPTKKPWKYGFVLNKPTIINISIPTLRMINGWTSINANFQTQTLLKPEVAEELIKLLPL